jgi:DNA-binding response OmpR family regulator
VSKKILLIDDQRLPKDIATGNLDENNKLERFKREDVQVARTFKEGIKELSEHRYDLLLLDHDLGDPDGNGYDVMCWLEEHSEHLPAGIKLVTANGAGGQRMLRVIQKLEEAGKTTYKGWV